MGSRPGKGFSKGRRHGRKGTYPPPIPRFQTALPQHQYISGAEAGEMRDAPPLPESAPASVLAAVDDLFFSVKINDTARRLGVKVRFVKSEQELMEAAALKPSLIIVDLNSAAFKPLQIISRIKADKELKRVSVIGYLSHVQGELKQKAHEIGCDMVLARSAFSQNLPNLLRRHGSNR